LVYLWQEKSGHSHLADAIRHLDLLDRQNSYLPSSAARIDTKRAVFCFDGILRLTA
jgi:hypothetical protein